jgi:hypothetical protein
MGMDDTQNVCMNAHSQEELDEWNERFKWRRMKMELAKRDGVLSYVDELLEEYELADQGISVV